jgi:hypothetical protein
MKMMITTSIMGPTYRVVGLIVQQTNCTRHGRVGVGIGIRLENPVVLAAVAVVAIVVVVIVGRCLHILDNNDSFGDQDIGHIFASSLGRNNNDRESNSVSRRTNFRRKLRIFQVITFV